MRRLSFINIIESNSPKGSAICAYLPKQFGLLLYHKHHPKGINFWKVPEVYPLRATMSSSLIFHIIKCILCLSHLPSVEGARKLAPYGAVFVPALLGICILDSRTVPLILLPIIVEFICIFYIKRCD